MKLLIVSDIHGSMYYANKAIEAFKLHKATHIALLGDILYHGPRNPLPKDYNPKEVIALLNQYKKVITACRGNCDSEVDQMVLDFSITSDFATIQDETRQIILSHGHVYHPEHLPPMEANDLFLFGHIHIPIMKQQHDYFVANPGSISLPKENNPHTYAVLEGDHFTLYNDDHEVVATTIFTLA